jgi:hypothetical protein
MTRSATPGARRTAKLAALALIVTGAVPSPTSVQAADAPPTEWDGLVRAQNKQLDHVYILPGADFSGYKRVRLDKVEVSFDKNWKPNDSTRGVSGRLSDSDIERIRTTLADEFRKVFSEVLSKNGYPLVDHDDEDVLRVSPAIFNLYITAPEKMTAGRSRTYTTNAGHMSLLVELRDSVTNQLLGRAVDNVQGRETANFEITNSVTNLGAARNALIKWANILVKGLNDADGRAK